ncbi:hypothetical protein MTo_03198 [Microcystis aeruginosa NIES-1211]|uniref:hypothetical protein n=1 Tax=Microcystis TaxID=1125 RepID=UPI0002F96810|nr:MULTISPECIES: hypothetical protein [Microcystis]GBL15880.1 hypothetical protein MTo_03198 [Microcystis aeruginosa NIES-1211]GCA85050.1 hypothetical protein MiHa_03027 [Microcystis aeruginosa NIES-2522]GCA89962.1 hypothetical protein MiTa_03317 [Microcystis aeruginosa NIES-4264]
MSIKLITQNLEEPSGGYRVIYYLQTQTAIVLITLYSKTDQTDITDRAMAEAISQLDF